MTQSRPTLPALAIRNLSASYNNQPVLQNVNAEFPQGQLAAIVGPNGAGKSTLLKTTMGIVKASTGSALLLGQPSRKALRQVAYVPQREEIDWDFPITVREVVEMGRYPTRGWLRRLQHVDHEVVNECLARVQIESLAHRQIGALSGGQRQRVFVARALAQKTPIMLLDEPFAGIDTRTEAAILKLMIELRQEGKTIIVVHHNLTTVRRLFDWVLLLNVHAIACGRPDQALSEEKVNQAYGTLDIPAIKTQL